MAAVSAQLSYSIQDSEREIVSVDFPFTAGSGLLADMQAAAAAHMPVLDAILEAQILKADIVIPLALAGGLKSSPVAGGRNEHGVVASYTATGTRFHYGQDFPSFIQSGILDKKIDPTNAAWINYLAVSLATTSTTVFTDKYKDPLAALFRTFENFRKYRRALVRAK
jgi:hypothetical protein